MLKTEIQKNNGVIGGRPTKRVADELLFLGAIEQPSRMVNMEVIALETLGDWLNTGRTPLPEDWDWEK